MQGETMKHEEAMAVAARGDRAELKDLVPALSALFDRVRHLERARDAAHESRMAVAMPDGVTAVAVNEIMEEFHAALTAHGPLYSPHEGLGVLREEYLELEEWIMLKPCKRDPLKGRGEAKQVAAVALRFMLDCCAPQSAEVPA
jgi:hypothetical protein